MEQAKVWVPKLTSAASNFEDKDAPAPLCNIWYHGDTMYAEWYDAINAECTHCSSDQQVLLSITTNKSSISDKM